MADATYQPKVYKKQGGDELHVASGGKIILESGGLITDEAATAAGAGLSPNIWDDCPRLQMLLDPTLGHFVGDDFTLANGESFTTAKNYTLAGANGTFTHLAADPNGVAVLTGPGTDNDECNVNLNTGVGILKLDATKDWWFEARVKLNQITTSQGVFVGLLTDDITMGTDFHTDATMAMKVQDTLGFQILAATDIAAVWQSMMQLTGGARAAINATLATASTGWVKLGMKCVSGTVTFYVNGVADDSTTTSATANYPLDQYVVPAFATKCGSAAANTLSIDWWYAAQLR
ncbi:MAG: hypothetical protein ABFD96_23900 [Armatimonadia bacterium]